MEFTCLSDFPIGAVLRVTHDSDDGTFSAGDLCWRSRKRPGGLDGINFVQAAACLDEPDCAPALVGAQFEESDCRYPG